MTRERKRQFVSTGWEVAIKSSLLSLVFAVLGFFAVKNYLDEELQQDIRFLTNLDHRGFSQSQQLNFEAQLAMIETLMLQGQGEELVSQVGLLDIVTQSWASLELLNGLEALSIYDVNAQLLKKHGSFAAEISADLVADVSKQGAPQQYIACNQRCQHIVSAPFLVANNQFVVLVWASNSATLLQNFSSITNTTAAFATSGNEGAFNLAGVVPESLHFQHLSTLAELVNHHGSSFFKPVRTIVENGEKVLSLNIMPTDAPAYITPTYLVWARDITTPIEQMRSALENAIAIMSIAALLLFALLVILLRDITQRSRRLSRILPMLTQAKFGEAEQALLDSSRERRFYNEIDGLYSISLSVTRQLKGLSEQVVEQNKRLHTMAYRDALTDLPNRQSFYELLDQQLRRLSRYPGNIGLLFIDVDDFKPVNDTFGHQAGDQVLVALAERVQPLIRQTDTLFRLAGDEFVVLCLDLSNADGLATIAEKSIAVMSDPVLFEGNELNVSLSIGGVMTSDPGVSPDHLIHQADEAMYDAKGAGKGRYQFCGIFQASP